MGRRSSWCPMDVNGWRLTLYSRNKLLLALKPKLPMVRADHVTLDVAETLLAPEEKAIRVYALYATEDFEIAAVTVGGSRGIWQPRGDRAFHVTLAHTPEVSSAQAGIILGQAIRENRIARLVYPIHLITEPFVRRMQ